MTAATPTGSECPRAPVSLGLESRILKLNFASTYVTTSRRASSNVRKPIQILISILRGDVAHGLDHPINPHVRCSCTRFSFPRTRWPHVDFRHVQEICSILVSRRTERCKRNQRQRCRSCLPSSRMKTAHTTWHDWQCCESTCRASLFL